MFFIRIIIVYFIFINTSLLIIDFGSKITWLSIPTSTKALRTTITVTNKNHTFDNAVDLSKVIFENLPYNYSSLTVTELKAWILKDITKVLANYPYTD